LRICPVRPIIAIMPRSHPTSRPYRRLAVPVAEGEQRSCQRLDWCSAKTRDAEGVWHPALTFQSFCPADVSVIQRNLTELPPFWARLAAQATDPLRRAGRPLRVTPGSRVLVSSAADALLREIAPVIGGWAARVQSVPGLSLSPSPHPFATGERLRDDCRTLALHTGPLLALQMGWTTRVYALPPGSPEPAPVKPLWQFRAPVKPWGQFGAARGTCRHCGRPVTRSPVSGWWWAADGKPGADCYHEADAEPQEKRGPVPDDVEDEIGEEEIVRIGDGWVKVMSQRDGTDAGLEILDLHYQARRLLGETPARPEPLDGVECWNCGEIKLVMAEPPSDPAQEGDYSRCEGCGHRMSRKEFSEWVNLNAAHARALQNKACRRCQKGDHSGCVWAKCSCALSGHLTAA
jgi:hypothetical protein